MLESFEAAEIQTGETSIFVRRSGSGPPILLLHGFPQTHLMWRGVTPLLARRFTVVCADLRGYGRSGCPLSTPDHAPYAKRAMAKDMVVVMERLGFPRFAVAGSDRGVPAAFCPVTGDPEHLHHERRGCPRRSRAGRASLGYCPGMSISKVSGPPRVGPA